MATMRGSEAISRRPDHYLILGRAFEGNSLKVCSTKAVLTRRQFNEVGFLRCRWLSSRNQPDDPFHREATRHGSLCGSIQQRREWPLFQRLMFTGSMAQNALFQTLPRTGFSIRGRK